MGEVIKTCFKHRLLLVVNARPLLAVNACPFLVTDAPPLAGGQCTAPCWQSMHHPLMAVIALSLAGGQCTATCWQSFDQLVGRIAESSDLHYFCKGREALLLTRHQCESTPHCLQDSIMAANRPRPHILSAARQEPHFRRTGTASGLWAMQ